MKHLPLLLSLLLLFTACSEKKAKFQLDPPVASQAILYQLNVRDFTPEGTFKAMLARLPELKGLGVNTLILAPIHPIGLKNRQGSLGSLYASTDFKGIHPDLGTAADFQELLDSCHANGLYVLLEWAATSTAADHPWVSSHPHWFKNDSLSYPLQPAAATAALNLNDSLLLLELGKQLTFWVDTMGIDGFYASKAAAYPTAWWSTTLAMLRQIKPLLLVANSTDKSLVKAGFDLLAAAPLSEKLDQLLGKAAELPVFSGSSNYFHLLAEEASRDSLRLPVLRYGNRKSAMIAALMAAILPGQPMLVAGEEVGHASPLLLTEKNLILWGANSDIRSFYATLFQVRKDQAALQSAEMTQDSLSHPKLLLLRRGSGLATVYCLINPTDSLASLQVPLELQGKRFTDCFTGRSVLLEKELLMLDYSFYLLKEDAAS